MVANPWGVTIGSLGVEEGFLSVDIQCESITFTREKLPFLENRRFDVRLRKG